MCPEEHFFEATKAIENYLDFYLKNFRQGCQNCILCGQKNNVGRKKMRKSYEYMKFFGFSAKKIGILWKKFSARLSKLLSRRPREKFEQMKLSDKMT